MLKYKDKDIGAKGVDPHVYAMGEAAFKHVKRHKTPAALVMSGESVRARHAQAQSSNRSSTGAARCRTRPESPMQPVSHIKIFKGQRHMYCDGAHFIVSFSQGAGKTETTKHLMRYLAWRSEAASIKAGSGDKLDKLADAILSTNPLVRLPVELLRGWRHALKVIALLRFAARVLWERQDCAQQQLVPLW